VVLHFSSSSGQHVVEGEKTTKADGFGACAPTPKGKVDLVEDVAEVLKPCGGSELLSTEQGNMASSDDMIPPIIDRPEVYGDLWKEQVDLAHLLPQERTRILDTLQRHRTMWDGRLGHAHTTHHRIELTPGAKPVHSHLYRAGPRAREVEAAELQRMLKAGVIEPSTAEWASPVVLVPNPDGSMRLCIDYRRLNALTLKDSYPSPRMY
jgi:hypothetical protein